MARGWVIFAAASGFLSVAAGALASHSLEPGAAGLLATAAQYVMAHALAILAAAALRAREAVPPSRWLAGSLWCFGAGIVLFGGGLALLALTGAAAAGAAIPVGGIAFLLGWAALLVAALVPPAP
jgi:uncharacterized membrane protein YgdD (TMEM256/DUF423 family)